MVIKCREEAVFLAYETTIIYTRSRMSLWTCLKQNLNASRPSEHPPVRGKMSKRLGGIIG